MTAVPDELALAVEELAGIQNRDDTETSDGPNGDSGENRDG